MIPRHFHNKFSVLGIAIQCLVLIKMSQWIYTWHSFSANFTEKQYYGLLFVIIIVACILVMMIQKLKVQVLDNDRIPKIYMFIWFVFTLLYVGLSVSSYLLFHFVNHSPMNFNFIMVMEILCFCGASLIVIFLLRSIDE